MQNHHDMMAHILEHGQYKPNRTGTGTFAEVGHMLKFDLSESFPAPTTKKFPFKSMTAELLGFFRGYDSAAQFRAIGCNIWNQNANETPNWLANPHRKGADDLGRIYSVQWTRWRDTRIARGPAEARVLMEKEYPLVAADPTRGVWVFEREINQLEEALRLLLTDPYSRRIIISGWRPDELDQCAIPVCHVAYQFLVMPDGTLHSTLWQRSYDSFLAYNPQTLALLTAIMARLSGRKLGTATLFVSDAHVYENHVDQVREQISRQHFAQPKLMLSDNIKQVTDLADIPGVFERIQPEDIWLDGYESHPAIKAPMAA